MPARPGRVYSLVLLCATRLPLAAAGGQPSAAPLTAAFAGHVCRPVQEAHARGLPATPGTLSTGSETTSGLGNTGEGRAAAPR